MAEYLCNYESTDTEKLEKASQCSIEEILWWRDLFELGQGMFNSLNNYSYLTPLHLLPEYNGKSNVLTYV